LWKIKKPFFMETNIRRKMSELPEGVRRIHQNYRITVYKGERERKKLLETETTISTSMRQGAGCLDNQRKRYLYLYICICTLS